MKLTISDRTTEELHTIFRDTKIHRDRAHESYLALNRQVRLLGLIVRGDDTGFNMGREDDRNAFLEILYQMEGDNY